MSEIRGVDGVSRPLEAKDIRGLAGTLSGSVLEPVDPGYDDSRRIWNGMIDRRPALIARCVDAADVVTAVNFARATGVVVSVRGGDHSAAGNAVCEGGMMIDLSLMKGLRVDPEARTARAEPGLRWAEFDAATQREGLATTGGTNSDTGVAGLTLGGGLGWLAGRYGLACDNLLEAEVVTADGQLLRASESENPDLFWALRGGSGNFGIVTSFTFQLHPVGPMVVAGLVAHPMERAVEVLRFYRQFVETIPDEINTVAGFLTTPTASRWWPWRRAIAVASTRGSRRCGPCASSVHPCSMRSARCRTQRFSRRSTRTSPGVAATTGSRLWFASCPMTRSRS